MNDYIKDSKDNLVDFYSRTPIVPVRGRDHWVWDVNGRKYLDLMSGIAVTSFGHSNKKIARAVKKQLDTLQHMSNLFILKDQAMLSKMIQDKAFKGKCFFCNSGAEANESALKMARIWGNAKKSGKNRVLALHNSFHGRTIATITLTGQDKYRKGFDPLLPAVDYVELNNTADLEAKFNSDVCAIFLEAVQAEGGILPLSHDFVAKIRELALKHNSLVIFDEVQCGIGRTGKYFGYQHFNIEPDIITMAKALGNGFPIGAALVKDHVADIMKPGMHASTFGGNLLATAAAMAALSQLDMKMLSHINSVSSTFKKALEAYSAANPGIITGVRAAGLLIGIDLDASISVADVISGMTARGILVIRAGTNVLRLVPPFTVTAREVDIFMKAFTETVEALKKVNTVKGGVK